MRRLTLTVAALYLLARGFDRLALWARRRQAVRAAEAILHSDLTIHSWGYCLLNDGTIVTWDLP